MEENKQIIDKFKILVAKMCDVNDSINFLIKEIEKIDENKKTT